MSCGHGRGGAVLEEFGMTVAPGRHRMPYRFGFAGVRRCDPLIIDPSSSGPSEYWVAGPAMHPYTETARFPPV